MNLTLATLALILATLTGALLASLHHAGDWQAGYAAGVAAPRAEDAPLKTTLCSYAQAACVGVKP